MSRADRTILCFAVYVQLHQSYFIDDDTKLKILIHVKAINGKKI